MKSFRFFTKSLIFVLILSALAFAQTENPQTLSQNKIAVINTEAFYHKDTGIKELADVYSQLEIEFKAKNDELALMFEGSKKMLKEIEDFGVCKFGCPSESVFKAKRDEYEKLLCKIQIENSVAKSLYKKRELELAGIVKKKVAEAIKQFAKEKGYVMVLDSSKDNASVIIEGETDEITKEFIKYYSENFTKSKSQ